MTDVISVTVDETAALVRVRGEYARHYDRTADEYAVTVYGLGSPVEYSGCLEYKSFVARVEWLGGARSGPAKDRAVLLQVLSENKYRIVGELRFVDERTTEVSVVAVFRSTRRTP